MTRDEIKAAGDLIAKLYRVHKDILDKDQRAAFATTVSTLDELAKHHQYKQTRECAIVDLEVDVTEFQEKSHAAKQAEADAYWANGANMISLEE